MQIKKSKEKYTKNLGRNIAKLYKNSHLKRQKILKLLIINPKFGIIIIE